MRQKRSRAAVKVIFVSVAALLVGANITHAKYSGGAGEPNDPYRVATPNDLNDIGNHPNDWDAHFVLVNDINLAEYTGTQFTTIGHWNSASDHYPFTGVFDGNGHQVFNLTYESNDVHKIGLFRYVDDPNAQIRDLTLVDSNVDAGA
ncbi:MAG: hypothetical protein ACYSX1_08015, partial [Planctomycetota bacterium]